MRSSALPWYTMASSSVHAAISRCQLRHTDSGQTMRNGPRSPWCWCRSCKNAAVWIVLPKPISSAKMELRFKLQLNSIHRTPSHW